MHESDARSVSTVPKGEQVKMTSFLRVARTAFHEQYAELAHN